MLVPADIWTTLELQHCAALCKLTLGLVFATDYVEDSDVIFRSALNILSQLATSPALEHITLYVTSYDPYTSLADFQELDLGQLDDLLVDEGFATLKTVEMVFSEAFDQFFRPTYTGETMMGYLANDLPKLLGAKKLRVSFDERYIINDGIEVDPNYIS